MKNKKSYNHIRQKSIAEYVSFIQAIDFWHEVQWNAQYPIGGYKIDHRIDPNPLFEYINNIKIFER